MKFQATREFAEHLDDRDPLGHMRSEFHIPKRDDERDQIYLCGNSLGLQPKRVARYLQEFLSDWQALGVKGHFAAQHPWMPYHESLAEPSAALVGALPQEVANTHSLTVNLHLLMVSFFRPTAERYKVLIEEPAFPSDRYAVVSQLSYHGIDPSRGLVVAKPRPSEHCLRQDDLQALIEREAECLALILLPGVQYYTGEVYDIAAITEAGHRAGACVGFDLAHAVGNVALSMHDWNVDFAAWCSYKYLNSGPGSVGGLFVHERHLGQRNLPRFAGWWGHDKQTRFQMGPDFEPIPTAEAWQLSNPAILSLAAVRASLDTFVQAGGIGPLREKSRLLTGYLRFLLTQELSRVIEIVTPSEPERQGCQLSLSLKLPGSKALQQELESQGVICDFRPPNVLRAAPVPLYNRFTDCYEFVQSLKKSLLP